MKVSAVVMALIGTSQAACPKYGLVVKTYTFDDATTCAVANANIEAANATALTALTAPMTEPFAWEECTLTTPAKNETTVGAGDAVVAQYSKTVCASDKATTTLYTDAACTAAVSGVTPAEVEYTKSCTASGTDFDYKIEVAPVPTVDCPVVKADLYEYAASDPKCNVTLDVNTTEGAAAAESMTFASGCEQTVEAVAETADGAGDAVDAKWSKSTCNAEKKMSVATYSDANCT